ncbi:MAG: SDR family NAD(P)-dependent oxidoreductase [Candidatus Sulfotelmatobacter sp.]
MVESTLDGLTALVTGASSGIGAETAVRFGANGAHTLIHYNDNRQGAVEVLDRIRQAGGNGELISADLSDSSSIARLTSSLHSLHRPIDILVNNAGSLIQRKPFLEISEQLWSDVFMLNVTSAFLTTQAVLPSMLQRRRGCVVNITSVAARFGGGIGAIAYSSAKAALSTMTKGLAREFGPKGIRVNAVSPGTIDTNYHRKFSTQQALDAVAAATPLQRLGTANDISDVVVFLCSEGARFIQGQVIEVNGGFLMV